MTLIETRTHKCLRLFFFFFDVSDTGGAWRPKMSSGLLIQHFLHGVDDLGKKVVLFRIAEDILYR